MSQRTLAELVDRCAASTNREERTDLTNKISESLHEEQEAGLRVLSPLFERESPDNWQSLTMILEEHSDRCDEVVDWLSELVERSEGEVRFRSLLCIMELDPIAYPRPVAQMLEAIGSSDLDAGRIAVVQYLAHVDRAQLRATLSLLSAELAGPMRHFIDGEITETVDDFERHPPGSVEELLAVAHAARQPQPEAATSLAELARRTDGAARAAAELLIRQQQKTSTRGNEPGG